MKHVPRVATTVLLVTLCVASAIVAAYQAAPPARSTSVPLTGSKGTTAGDGWQSAFMTLAPRRDFRVGDRFKIKLLGDAREVLVRFLPYASNPQTDDGVEGGVRPVRPNQILEVELTADHPNVSQISIHAGRSAWTTAFVRNNGTVSLVSIEYVPAAR